MILTFSGHLINGSARLNRHVAQHGENDEARQEAGQTVDGARGQRVPDNHKQCLLKKPCRI